MSNNVKSRLKNTRLSLLNNKKAVLAIFFIVTLACYYNVLEGQFFFDDVLLILENRHVTQYQIKQIYTNHISAGARQTGNFYRPHHQFLFAILYKLFGANPVPFHFVNILLHAINGFLLYILLRRMYFKKLPSVTGALFFLLHPVQTDAISYISGIADPLGAAFLFSALILLIKSYESDNNKKAAIHLGAAIFLFINGLLSKESIVVFLPLAVAVTIYIVPFQKLLSKRTVISLSAISAVTLAYLAMKFSVLQFTEHASLVPKSDPYTESLLLRLTTFVNIIAEYFKIILWPADLHWAKPYVAYTSIFTWRALPGNALFLTTIISFFALKKRPELFLIFFWFLGALSPFSGIIPLNAVYLEHWLYVPIAGISIVIARGLSNASSLLMYRISMVIILVMGLFYVPIIISRNRDWSNAERFYLNEISHTANPLCYNNLGKIYYIKKDYPKAEYYFLQTVSRFKPWAFPHHNLGTLYTATGHYQRAEYHFQQALSLNPELKQAKEGLYRLQRMMR